jgi:hypothetical protein
MAGLDPVAGFCAVTALLAALVRPRYGPTRRCNGWRSSRSAWVPWGAAFYAWDIGMKRGDIRVLGAASYATPLLSTAFLILAGDAEASANIALAALLIVGGGLIAAKDMVSKR